MAGDDEDKEEDEEEEERGVGRSDFLAITFDDAMPCLISLFLILLLLVLIQGQGEGKEGFVFLCLADKRDPLLGLCLCSCWRLVCVLCSWICVLVFVFLSSVF